MSGTTDVNWKSYVGETDLKINPDTYPQCPAPQNFDDILKFSNCNSVEVTGLTIEGGREDCIDAVRGSKYRIYDCVLNARFRALTAKGAIDGFELVNVKIQEAAEPALEFGQFDNYWYPGRPPTRNIVLHYVDSATPGKPLRLRLWDAQMPDIYSSDIKVIKVPKYIWYPYFLAQYVWVRIKGLKTE